MKEALGGAMIGFAVLQIGFFSIWVVQQGVNGVISYTPHAKNWEKCVVPYLPTTMNASTTEFPPKWLETCGSDPYLSIVPN